MKQELRIISQGMSKYGKGGGCTGSNKEGRLAASAGKCRSVRNADCGLAVYMESEGINYGGSKDFRSSIWDER